MEAIGLVGKYRIHIAPRSKYGFADMEIGETKIVEGEFRIVRISADGFRKRWGMWFHAKDLKDGRVEIKRYK